MTDIVQQIEDALAGMTPGLKADPYGTPGRYTQAADGEIIIRTQYERDQRALLTFQQHGPALVAEVKRLRKIVQEIADRDGWQKAAILRGEMLGRAALEPQP